MNVNTEGLQPECCDSGSEVWDETFNKMPYDTCTVMHVHHAS